MNVIVLHRLGEKTQYSEKTREKEKTREIETGIEFWHGRQLSRWFA